MDTNPEVVKKTIDWHQIVSWSLLIALLTLRIPFAGVLRILTQADWVITVFQVGTYFFTAIFLWWECKNLPDFHVDMLALGIIILFKPLQTLILRFVSNDEPLAFPSVPSLMIWVIAIGLAIALWFNRKDLPKFQWKSLGWFGIGTLAGIILAVVLAIPGAYQIGSSLSPIEFWQILRDQIRWSFFFQIGYAAVSEEPLFRGFLWGALRKVGWKEVWIWLVQAALFTVAHMYYFGNHWISLFVLVPMGGLALGLIVWKSRTISASMPLHGALNSLGTLFASLARFYIFK